ncbi:hypothetical protein [Salinibacterium sp. NK8237]|uniref:hypothetical protein n=1 Tax=Salinibacterium sp. NK8237 TaxID=2792038 RepID=UPI0018CD775B|nr:hypothetical protein [Salinibacterium sp. NK8237]MBH0131009.1 hypothetical protein [Salinibacterium sp. NK8237]
MKRIFEVVAPYLLLFLVLGALVFVTICALTTWPNRILEFSDVDSDSLSAVERADALQTARTSVLTALGGISATALVFSALWQVVEFRSSRILDRSVAWSDTYAAAAGQLGSESATLRLAGVVTLSSIVDAGPAGADSTIRATLASFIRTRSASDQNEFALKLALEHVCNSTDKSAQSFQSANLADVDLSTLDFDGIVLDGVSFRSATLHSRQRAFIDSAKNVDLAGVSWVDG